MTDASNIVVPAPVSSLSVDTGCDAVTIVGQGSLIEIVAATAFEVAGSPTAVEVCGPGPRGAAGPQGPAGPSGGSIAPILFSYGDAPSIVWTAPAAGVLTDISLDITSPFNSPFPNISVGTIADPGSVMAPEENDPTQAYEYQNTANLYLTEGQGVRLLIESDGATSGAGALYLTFIPN